MARHLPNFHLLFINQVEKLCFTKIHIKLIAGTIWLALIGGQLAAPGDQHGIENIALISKPLRSPGIDSASLCTM